MWVRGLKLCIIDALKWAFLVAPYVGAWIETPYQSRTLLFD